MLRRRTLLKAADTPKSKGLSEIEIEIEIETIRENVQLWAELNPSHKRNVEAKQ